jgi:hypothetical protein
LRVLIDASAATSHPGGGPVEGDAGRIKRAIDEPEAACRRRLFEVMFVAVDPVFKPLHGQPRFQRLVAGMVTAATSVVRLLRTPPPPCFKRRA